MKNSSQKPQSKKKQKPTLTKTTSAGTLFKKVQIKKPILIKKEETPITSTRRQEVKSPIVHSVNNSNSKSTTTASSTGTRSTKYIVPSLKQSPKSSLGQVNSLNIKKKSVEPVMKMPITRIPSRPELLQTCKVKQQIKKSLANVIKVYHPQKKPYLDVSLTQVTKEGNLKEDNRMNKNDFNFLTVIGEGGYGKVWKVQNHKTRITYAMKEMSKAVILMKKSAQNVLNQMKILSKLKNPFIANMSFAFNDRDNLYLGMDYLPGGDLRSFLSQSQKLSEQSCKFIIACIIKSLQYIHNNKIFHRDIKPQNLVIDEQGYLRLTDFGIARSARQKQCLDASGTPGYMAPQVLCKQVHSYSVDFYAVGIIAYELMIGKRPYNGNSRIQIRDAILAKQHALKKQEIPQKWAPESADFINKLIQRNPLNRLGHKNGIQQLKQHPWLKQFQWKQMENKKIVSPIVAKCKGVNVTDRNQGNQLQEAINQFKLLQRAEEKVDVFAAYFFNNK